MTNEKFSISEYLMAQRSQDEYCDDYPIAKRIVCVDGFSFSVQANAGAYCTPRTRLGPWFEVEVGFPNGRPEFIFKYAEDPRRPTDTVYPYVPIELVEKLINYHGGPNEETRVIVRLRP